jgi:hypothetical protein
MRCPWILVLTVIVLGAPASAAAQELTQARVQFEIDQSDERIAQAEIVVSASDHEAAQQELDIAIGIQGQAKSELRGGRLRSALDLTLRARSRAARAVSMVRGLPDPDRVLAQLERTREVIERARERIEACDDDRARSMIRAAADMQARAEAAFRGERYLAALQMTTSARERATRALGLCRIQENLGESAERALRRTDQVIERARERIAERDGRGRRALGRAIDLQEKAWREYRAERYEASLRLTQTARAFAHRAIRSAGG